MAASDAPAVIICVQFDVHPHSTAAFAEALNIGAAQRTRFEGCLRVDAYRSVDDPTLFTLVEVFRTQAAVDAYYQSALQKAWMASITPLIRGLRSADQQLIFSSISRERVEKL